MDKIIEERKENAKLAEIAKDYKLVRKALGEEKTDDILKEAKITKRTSRIERRNLGR